MSSTPNNLFAADNRPTLLNGSRNNPHVEQAQQKAEDAMAFQLWVSEQSHALARLKIFHSMAKTINDQQ